VSDLHWGIDLGGTKIECAVLDGGKCIARQRIPTEADQGYRHILARIKLLIEQTAAEVGTPPSKIGIGTPGTCDPETGLMRGCNTTCLNGQPLLKDLESALQMEVRIANDANCFALAEATLGSGREARVVFGVILGTGVGGGIVVDGKVLNGLQGIAGEWGHNLLEPDGEPCYCGRRGCVETVLSGPALQRFYFSLTNRHLDLREIVRNAEADDAESASVVQRLVQKFGEAIGPVINILDPDLVILGGGVGSIPALLAGGADAARPYIFNPNPRIRLAAPTLGDSAGVFGAALLVRD
jgi:predicted NBD/HSP70 family sugar kinase